MSLAVPSNPAASLMGLPSELRLDILERLLVLPAPIVVRHKVVPNHSGLLLVCRQLYHESKSVFAKNVLRYTSVRAMVSGRSPVSHQMTKHIQVDFMFLISLKFVDVRTYSNLDAGWLATICTLPGQSVGRYLHYERRDRSFWNDFADAQLRLRQSWPSACFAYHHLPHYGQHCRYNQADFDRWMETEPLNLETFTINVGAKFAAWILSPSVSSHQSQYAARAEPLLVLRDLISMGLRHAKRTVVAGKGAKRLQPLWDALITCDGSMLEDEDIKALFKAIRGTGGWCLERPVTFKG